MLFTVTRENNPDPGKWQLKLVDTAEKINDALKKARKLMEDSPPCVDDYIFLQIGDAQVVEIVAYVGLDGKWKLGHDWRMGLEMAK